MASVFGLGPDEFWSAPFRTELQVFDQLMSEDFSGVRIDAPEVVDIELRKSLPVIACRFGSHKDVWDLDLFEHGVVAAVNLENNVTYAGLAREEGEEDRRPAPKPEIHEFPEGYIQRMKRLDLEDLLALPWQPGTYQVVVLMRDRVSNRVEVRLGEGSGSYVDPEVERYLRARRAQVQPMVFPLPGQPIPSYAAHPKLPPVPDQPGIRIAADRVVPLTKDARCLLRGSYRLPVLPQEIVKPDQPQRQLQPDRSGRPLPAPVAAPGATAAPGITLLLTGADVHAPELIRIQVPSYDAVDPGQEAPVVTGHFVLDLLSLTRARLPAQTYFLYALSGRVLSGPYPIALISEHLLPRGAR